MRSRGPALRSARRAGGLALSALLGALAITVLAAGSASARPASRFDIRHVFVIVLENESASTTFGPGTPAPYLAHTLTSRGVYLPNYYGIGHLSNDNYIAMISGQAPNPQTQADCPLFDDFSTRRLAAFGQQTGTGCVYPADIPTIASQLAAHRLTWRDYNQSMGADRSRESATCGHPAVDHLDNTQHATRDDMYATRHNPFVYFHSVIDHPGLCNGHVVRLGRLRGDLARVSRTRNYTFISPDLCDDGHDSPCADGRSGGLAQADRFLRSWVPRITRSAAFRRDGLLVITFDEAATSDASSCCHEIAGPGAARPGGIGPGGGRVGAVLLSPCVEPGTVSRRAYNHYTLLGSVERIFGLKRLGYARLPHERYFGTDIYKRRCGPAPPSIHARPPLTARDRSTRRVRFVLRWRASTRRGTGLAYFRVQRRRTGRWVTVASRDHRGRYAFTGTAGRRYRFRARAVNRAGQASRWSAVTVGTAAS